MLESYLKNSLQRVLIDNKLRQYSSKRGRVSGGAPPGFILALLLLLQCINDIPKSILDTSKPFPFADDTSMTIKYSDAHEISNTINNYIIDISSSFISKMLHLNIDKTQFTQFLMKNIKLTYQFRMRINVIKVQILNFLGLQ